MDWRRAEREFEPDLAADTLAGTFDASARAHFDGVAARYKSGVADRSLVAAGLLDPPHPGEYGDLTYGRMRDIVRGLSYGFRTLGVAPGDRVGLFAPTRLEWALSDFALLGCGGVVTTVYNSSSERQVEYLLADSDATGVVVEGPTQFERVLAAEEELNLEFIVLIDQPHGDSAVAATARDRDDVHTLAAVYDAGDQQAPVDDASPDPPDPEVASSTAEWTIDRAPDSTASLIYTSGTTGQPKGVELTHRNFLSNVEASYRRFGPRPDKPDTETPVIDADTTTLSFLPLAHVFERMSGHFLMYAAGATVAYAESPDTLREDFALVQPDVATSVPRVYEKLYQAIREQAAESAIGTRIFPWATEVGRRYHRTDDPGIGLRLKQGIADRLVFSSVREALGGNIDFFISGGGSLSSTLCELYHGMGIPVLEGYGLTETAPVVSVNPPEAPRVGTIGPPVHGVDVRVDERVGSEADPSLSDAEAVTEIGTGELLVRGPNVFPGYWQRPQETESAFTTLPTGPDGESERWFRTGDVVDISPDTYLTFRERAKQLLKLSTGKMVAPRPLEDAFVASEFVDQVFVIGDERKFVSALLVPNFSRVRSWATTEGITLSEDPAEICQDDRVRSRIEREIEQINADFEKHERIKRFRLVPTEFTENNDLLTPTLKKKRRNIADRFEEEIESMYA